jgi:hypothetical protein
LWEKKNVANFFAENKKKNKIHTLKKSSILLKLPQAREPSCNNFDLSFKIFFTPRFHHQRPNTPYSRTKMSKINIFIVSPNNFFPNQIKVTSLLYISQLALFPIIYNRQTGRSFDNNAKYYHSTNQI